MLVCVQAKAVERQQSNADLKYPKTTESGELNILSALIARGEFSQATDIITKHLARYPGDADYLILLARVKQKTGDTAGAIDVLSRARSHAKTYEDIYLLEVGLLHDVDGEEACRKQMALYDDYRLNTRQEKITQMDNRVFDRKRGSSEVQLESQYDELSNGRGVWHAYSVANKYTSCAGTSLYAGLNTVERYSISDSEGFVGGGIQAGNISIELEYRQSQERNVLARNVWSAVLGMDTGLSANLMLLASRKEYQQIETDSSGLGVDYYFSDFQLTWILAETNYYRGDKRLDSSTEQRYYLTYYFDTRKYLRLSYISGKELDNDGSANPPYSGIRTMLLTSYLPLSARTGMLMEFKRHHQSGYYEQNGIRIAFSIKYQ